MRYEELYKEMEQFKYTLDEPYIFWDFDGTADIIAEAYCNEHGISNMKSIEDAKEKYTLYLASITERPMEELIEGGNLQLIAYRFQETVAVFLDEHTELWCGYIQKYNLTDKLDFYMCVNFKDALFDLEDLFVEFCAFQYYHEHRSKRTIEQYCGFYNYLPDELKFMKLSKIKAKELDHFLETELLSYEMRLKRLKSILRFYKMLFRFAMERGICTKNPMQRIDVSKYYPLCHFRFNPAFLTEDNGG
jgi:predicted PolB exonuclease-like 3'-5' exonuclease